jgi:2-polyprenyl-3-methyl-5-hydroxy-6-metoxy-1,4-benzoquinol methylase
MDERMDVSFYENIYSNIDRGDIRSVSELEAGTSAALDLNYRVLLPESSSARILDVGCGWGYLLHYLKKRGYSNIEGIDSSHHSRRLNFIKDTLKIDAVGIEKVEDYLNANKGKYDLIVMQQVIYYFKREDLPVIMKAAYDALRPGGRIIVEVFNGSLLTSVFVQGWDYERTMIFTEFSLAEILIDSGFKLMDISGMKTPPEMRFRSRMRRMAQDAWLFILKCIYMLERGKDPVLVPRIYAKHLIAVAEKRSA